MRYGYKTKSIEERLSLVEDLLGKYNLPDTEESDLLHDIETHSDWVEYPYVTFNLSSLNVNLSGNVDTFNPFIEVNSIGEFLDISKIGGKYNYFTITKHKFV